MLHWKGKRPFTSTQYYPAQLKEQYGEPVDGWLNEIYWGDNLQVMSHLLKKYRGQVKLVYIDPPFDSKADYKKKVMLKGKKVANNYNSFEEKQYTDIWTNDDYLQFMYERLILLRELLSISGSVIIHCDYRKSHYLKVIMDEIFSSENFQSNIIWRSMTSSGFKGKTSLGKSHADLLYYTRSSSNFTYNPIHIPYTKGYVEQRFNKKEVDGRRFKDEKIGTATPKETIEKLKEENRIYYTSTGGMRIKQYLDESEGILCDNIWTDIYGENSQSLDLTNYPTQKPTELLDRIIRMFSNENDLILDCFMGSGTTQAVAMKLGRRFIGADINLGAIQTTTKRLIQVAASLNETAVPEQQKADEASDPEEQFELPIAAEPKATYQIKTIENQPDNDDSDEAPNDDDANSPDTTSEEIKTFYTGFTVYNVNHYDVFRNPVQAKDLLIEALEINPLPGNSLYDGEKDGRMVKIMPVNRIATPADLAPLLMGFDLKTFAKRKNEKPTQPVEKLLLVCMGHDPNLQATLIKEMRAQQFEIDVDVVDILRDKANLEFRRDSKARIVRNKGKLVIEQFYPMNLLQKLSLLQENVEDWRELVESVMIDWHYDGAVFEPKVVDVPGKEELVSGEYNIPDDAGTIRVKITDLLSESLEETVE
ncbi:MAG: site-specific DNA-methyltransferase [Bacteroidales bacterium]|nr:site-specific DNA-methyltransferase [Bacteroidales bacterium]